MLRLSVLLRAVVLTQIRSCSSKDLLELRPEDLREQMVKGSGPGGQATNKTNNCAFIKHLPSGILVKCHQTRSAERNRELALRILREKVDLWVKGDGSVVAQERLKWRKQKTEKKQRSRDSLERKLAFKKRLQQKTASVGEELAENEP
uniref:mitochondrial translation release factor in rescue n=1 Tax=Myxine glutinosa TaxID=7769 RepID=UPI00358FB38B